ncbi:hypothetical protein HMN09_00990700 [Mycena chlorophos]|uniref:DUF6533 domain-containing protein n=1 Tax=Mycena chlorophos TaxID=658473 RepID=A0A8H6W304_MYCCL|nr:hypothetical protein HMN09_00990700 [Mycena chlorophos]
MGPGTVQPDSDPLGVQTQLQQLNFLNLISYTLLVYEYFCLLSAEVDRFWCKSRSRTTFPAILFFVNRYVTLLGNLPMVIVALWNAAPSARKTATYHQFYIIITQGIVGIILVLRTYALYGRTRRILIALIVLALTTTALAAGGMLISLRAPDAGVSFGAAGGCVATKGRIQSLGLLMAWAAMGAFDCTIFGLTVYRTLRDGMWAQTGSLHSQFFGQFKGMRLLQILLRDGAIYFLVMVLFNVANMITFLVGNAFNRGLPSVLGNVLSSIMITRFMLHLRDPALGPGPFAVNSSGTMADLTISGTGTSGVESGFVVARPGPPRLNPSAGAGAGLESMPVLDIGVTRTTRTEVSVWNHSPRWDIGSGYPPPRDPASTTDDWDRDSKSPASASATNRRPWS